MSTDRAGRYFVSILCELGTEALPLSPKTGGVGLGQKDLFVTSDGFTSGDPRYTRKYAAKLACLPGEGVLSEEGFWSAPRTLARQGGVCQRVKRPATTAA